MNDETIRERAERVRRREDRHPRDMDRRYRHVESTMVDLPGISFDPSHKSKPWRVTIYRGGKRRHRRVATVEEAVGLRRQWEFELGPSQHPRTSYEKRTAVVVWT